MAKKLKAEKREARNIAKMKVSGKSVFKLKEILKKKARRSIDQKTGPC